MRFSVLADGKRSRPRRPYRFPKPQKVWSDPICWLGSAEAPVQLSKPGVEDGGWRAGVSGAVRNIGSRAGDNDPLLLDAGGFIEPEGERPDGNWGENWAPG